MTPSPLLRRLVPATTWASHYDRSDLRPDVTAGLTIGAMLVPQAMAYALLAGLPPEIGLYASIVPVVVYALLGTSRQLAVGPVAIVSLLTASALGSVHEQGTAGYVAAATLLALLVGVVHLVIGVARLGGIVNLLSHAVLVGFTAAAAIIIGLSQVQHVLGVRIERSEHVHETVDELVRSLGAAHGPTLAVGAAGITVLLAVRRWAPRVPGALLVVAASIAAVHLFDLERRGVRTVGDIPNSLPAFGLPAIDGGAIGTLVTTALVITLVGFMESIAVAKVYARRHGYQIDPNQELIGLGAANVASGLFGGYPVTGGFSRTAVNDAAGARTPLASVVTAAVVLVAVVLFTPLFEVLPQAALGAIIIVAVVNLVDIREMRHIARVKRSDLIGLGVGFTATLVLGIEIGIGVAVVASMLVVFARMSRPHTAVLGRIPDTTTYRNVARFPEATTVPGVRVVRIDAAVSFVNAQHVQRLCLAGAAAAAADHLAHGEPGVGPALVIDCEGINDLDVTGAEALGEVITELAESSVAFHLSDVKGPVRDVLQRAGLWDRLAHRIHASAHDAVVAITGDPRSGTLRDAGIDERRPEPSTTTDPPEHQSRRTTP